MRMYDLLVKKRDGNELSKEEIFWMIDGYVHERIPDYQMSAMLMAIYWRGLTDEELGDLTSAMASSGQQIDLSAIDGIKVDKHSTGGVGDKTTFIVGSIVAACGGKVAKMSGRGLGHTGGTIDKMEAIPGIHTELSQDEFMKIVNDTGLCVIGQSGELAPADKLLYALRDVTGTVESLPLIASSIMSKKLAAGSDAIVLDVKVGSGAFMKDLDRGVALAEKMVAIGTRHNRETVALVTEMNEPLGRAIGNALEIREVIEILKNEGLPSLREACVELAAHMLFVSRKGDIDACRRLAKTALMDGTALKAFGKMIEAQGGDSRVLNDAELLVVAPKYKEVKANRTGYLVQMDAFLCGKAASLLGAGRETKESSIDLGAGIYLHKKVGDFVEEGELVATLYAATEDKLADGCAMMEDALVYDNEASPQKGKIDALVNRKGVHYYD